MSIGLTGHHQVLELLRQAGAEGLTAAELATKLGISVRVIKRYTARCAEQLEYDWLARKGRMGHPAKIWYLRGARK